MIFFGVSMIRRLREIALNDSSEFLVDMLKSDRPCVIYFYFFSL